jgi:hypothetical protein
MMLIAGAEDTERFSKRMNEDSSAERWEVKAGERWISLQNFFGREAEMGRDFSLRLE